MLENRINRHKIIVNPTAGRGNGERIIPSLQESLRKQGVDYDLVRTERPFHATELAQQAAEAGEVPVGAVIVVGDRVVGRGHSAFLVFSPLWLSHEYIFRRAPLLNVQCRYALSPVTLTVVYRTHISVAPLA